MKWKNREEYLFPFIFTKTITQDELDYIMNTAIEQENYEKCELIKSLKDKYYFKDLKKRKFIITDYLYELKNQANKLDELKNSFKNGNIEKEEALEIFENSKKVINDFGNKLKGLTIKDFINQIERRISKIKKSKSPFGLFSDNRKLWKLYKEKVLNEEKMEIKNIEEYIKTQLKKT